MLSKSTVVGCISIFLTLANAAGVSCDATTHCPESAPCCSLYGECGVGAYCLGGCDPLFSYTLGSCVPAPVCKSANFEMNSLSDVQSNSEYLGDSSKANWVSEGTPVVYSDNSILLTMAQDTPGTLLTSTHYVWYGKISVTMQSSASPGVVTAFILQSDVRDELDFEFVGADLQHVQSNWYWQGVLNYTNSANLSAPNTNSQTHVYTFDWQPESVTWSVDNQPLRTLYAADTYNATTGEYQYPQTPSRIMLSLWPAGSPTNGKGTIDWAGGLIDWNSPYMTNGYFWAQVLSVDVECYGAPANANVTGSKSYLYNNEDGLASSVAVTDQSTILSSFYATGENQNYDPDASSSSSSDPTETASASSSGTASSSSAASTSDVQTVPGQSGGGVRGDSGSSSGSSSSSSSSSGVFSQGLEDKANAAVGAHQLRGERALLRGSALGVLVAFAVAIAA